jgi:hypothetical protein
LLIISSTGKSPKDVNILYFCGDFPVNEIKSY